MPTPYELAAQIISDIENSALAVKMTGDTGGYLESAIEDVLSLLAAIDPAGAERLENEA